MSECLTEGIIIAAKRCWWLKINTKPVRKHALNGAEFERRKIVVWKNDVPRVGQTVIVRYGENPTRLLKVCLDDDMKKR